MNRDDLVYILTGKQTFDMYKQFIEKEIEDKENK